MAKSRKSKVAQDYSIQSSNPMVEPGKSVAPPRGLSRDEHIEFRRPWTEARHERIAGSAAPNQKPGIKNVTDVEIPGYQSGGWLKPGGGASPTWAAERDIRQKVLSAAQTYQSQMAPMHPQFSHVVQPQDATRNPTIAPVPPVVFSDLQPLP